MRRSTLWCDTNRRPDTATELRRRCPRPGRGDWRGNRRATSADVAFPAGSRHRAAAGAAGPRSGSGSDQGLQARRGATAGRGGAIMDTLPHRHPDRHSQPAGRVWQRRGLVPADAEGWGAASSGGVRAPRGEHASAGAHLMADRSMFRTVRGSVRDRGGHAGTARRRAGRVALVGHQTGQALPRAHEAAAVAEVGASPPGRRRHGPGTRRYRSRRRHEILSPAPWGRG